MPTDTLPEPSPDALALSTKLAALIAREIQDAGDWISFSRYMELALYAPGLGYYSAGSTKLGAAGDFVTAPEISALFGQTLAQQVGELISAETSDVLELGAGSGKLACDLLLELESLQRLPARYLILELSADLRERQRALVSSRVPHLTASVHWLTELPAAFCGVVIANEVLDALPVHVIAWQGETAIAERGVTGDAQAGFRWAERPASGKLRNAAREIAALTKFRESGDAAAGAYISEINLAAGALVASLSNSMLRGVILLIDYGFPRHEYYHPQRASGTLMCHYRHRSHADPFFLPGLQDITAHVDFTAIRDAATGAGLDCLGFATQAQFLINCGITDVLSRISPAEPARYLPLAAQVQKLLSPSEMGELFKVIALAKGVDSTGNPPLRGFAAGDMHARLG